MREGLPSHLVKVEVAYFAMLAIFTLVRLETSSYGGLTSLRLIRTMPPLVALFDVFTSSSASALLTLGLSVIHPALAGACVASITSSSSHVIASTLAGVCPLPHALYSLLEDQAYLLAISMGLTERSRQLSSASLSERWTSSLEFLREALPLVTATFLLLSALEVGEALWLPEG